MCNASLCVNIYRLYISILLLVDICRVCELFIAMEHITHKQNSLKQSVLSHRLCWPGNWDWFSSCVVAPGSFNLQSRVQSSPDLTEVECFTFEITCRLDGRPNFLTSVASRLQFLTTWFYPRECPAYDNLLPPEILENAWESSNIDFFICWLLKLM